MSKLPKNFKTILLCDETKFSLNAKDSEDAIFYFAVAIKPEQVAIVHREIQTIFAQKRIQAKVFHSTTIFSERKIRVEVMNALTDLVVREQLHFFPFKYDKALLYEVSKKYLSYLNKDGIIDFSNVEFQAFFYFINMLNTELRDTYFNILPKDFVAYFDRNVYGSKDTEAFNFDDEYFVIKRMTHSEKSLISLLCLPDFLGYVFRKAKIGFNKFQADNNYKESSVLTKNSLRVLEKVTGAGLFHFLDIDKYVHEIDKLFVFNKR